MSAPKPHRLLLASTALGAVGLALAATPAPQAAATAEQPGSVVGLASVGAEGTRPLDPDRADAAALTGFRVVDDGGRALGRIVDLVEAEAGDGGPEVIRYAVLATDAAPGLDEGLHPVPLDVLRIAGDADGLARDVIPADRWPGEPEPSGLLGLEAGELVDREVWSETGEPVARIEDVAVIDRRLHLVLSVGGFLGLADREVALPVGRFELRVDDVVLTRPVTEEELEALAPYRPEQAGSVPPDLVLADVMAVIDGPAADLPGAAPDSPAAGTPAATVLVLEIDRGRFGSAPEVAPEELSAAFEPAWRDDVLAFYRDLLPAGAAPHSPPRPGAEGGGTEQPADRLER